MSQRDDKQFFKLYQAERFEDQLGYYKRTREEFDRAKTETVIGSVTLLFLTGAAGLAAPLTTLPWLKLLFLLVAAISPIFSTTLAAYSALYGFEHQAKLYQDTVNNLLHARALSPTVEQNLTETEFARLLNEYVQEVEKTIRKEQGQWGQLAEHMKPPET
ncbi:MAG TPA: SLATT domain-containing protein [Ktedonobacteraceae bacterium]|jgi:hypothetical protein|nr:SLATT domain-containing protein [Ktedonobacteraceae bacterium]